MVGLSKNILLLKEMKTEKIKPISKPTRNNISVLSFVFGLAILTLYEYKYLCTYIYIVEFIIKVLGKIYSNVIFFFLENN